MGIVFGPAVEGEVSPGFLDLGMACCSELRLGLPLTSYRPLSDSLPALTPVALLEWWYCVWVVQKIRSVSSDSRVMDEKSLFGGRVLAEAKFAGHPFPAHLISMSSEGGGKVGGKVGVRKEGSKWLGAAALRCGHGATFS